MNSSVQCRNCKHISTIKEVFFDLSLEIVNLSTLNNALDHFFKTECLSKKNSFKCEKCKKYSQAMKRYQIKKPSKILTIHLKRFTNVGMKIGRYIQISSGLNMRKYSETGEEMVYLLYGMIVHQGSSSVFGHYYAYIRKPNGLWFRVFPSFSIIIDQDERFKYFFCESEKGLFRKGIYSVL